MTEKDPTNPSETINEEPSINTGEWFDEKGFINKSDLMKEIGIKSKLSWNQWCNIIGSQGHKESYSEQEVNRLIQLKALLKSSGKFNEKGTPSWLVFWSGIIAAILLGSFLGYFIGSSLTGMAFSKVFETGICSPQSSTRPIVNRPSSPKPKP